MRIGRFALVPVLLICVLALGACAVGVTVRGGGWIPSAVSQTVYPGKPGGIPGKVYPGRTGNGPIYKATFGFQLAMNKDGTASGQVQYVDHAARVDFHGTVALKTSYPVNGVDAGLYTGTYRPNGKSKAVGGTFEIFVEDRGEPGPSNGDYYFVTLYGGVYDGYSNGGVLGGGNIQAAKK